MIYPGLVSITFRKLSPKEIVAMVCKAGQAAIEWGGDIHVPHGNLEVAREVGRITRNAGLEVSSYGSYYEVGHEETVSFQSVLETAVELAAPKIRVWAGKCGSSTTDAEYRSRIVADSQRIAELAKEAGVKVAYEYHSGTLTNTNVSARRLLEEVAHENIFTFWQPPIEASLEYCIEGLDSILHWLCDVHVFHWGKTAAERFALAQGQFCWSRYLRKIASTGRDHFLMIEFVKNDAIESYLEDAATLNNWLSRISYIEEH